MDPEFDGDPLGVGAIEADLLKAKEKVLWTGRPGPWDLALRRVLPAFVVASMGCILLLGLLGGKAGAGPGRGRLGVDPGATVFALLLALVMGRALAEPFLAWRRARRTRYLLTERRAIVVRPDFFGNPRTDSYPVDRLALAESRESGGGSGSLIFGRRPFWIPPLTDLDDRLGFLDIGDVRAVAGLVRRLADRAPETSPASPAAIGSILADAVVDEETVPETVAIHTLQRPAMFTKWVMEALSGLFFVIGLGLLLTGNLVGLLPCAVGLFLFWGNRRYPAEIRVHSDRTLTLHPWPGSSPNRSIPIRSIRSIATSYWLHRQRKYFTIAYRTGRVECINKFHDFPALLILLKTVHPSIEVEGFA